MGEPMTIDDVRARLEAAFEANRWRREDIRALLDDHAAITAKLEAVLDVLDTPMEQRHAADMRDAAREKERPRSEVERLTRERDAAVSSLGAAHTTLAEAYRLREDRDRLTRERDEAHATLGDLHTRWAAVTSDRDRLAAALAEVREAWDEVDIGDLAAGIYAAEGSGPDGRERLAKAQDSILAMEDAVAGRPADLAAAHDARVRAEALRCAAVIVLTEIALTPFDATSHVAKFALTAAANKLRAEAERTGGAR